MNHCKNMDSISKGIKKPEYEHLILRFFYALTYFQGIIQDSAHTFAKMHDNLKRIYSNLPATIASEPKEREKEAAV